jgi:hypothetical protein
MAEKENIEKQIDELRNTTDVASLNYKVWWTYKERESRKKYVDTMNHYSLFFQTSIHAHFVALLIALYRLYETRPDTVNIPGLIRLLKESSTFPKKTLNKVEKLYKQAKVLWVKVCILRNEAFGHRSMNCSITDVFQKVGVKPKDFRELIEKTEEMLNVISYQWNRSRYQFTLKSEIADDTTRLLEDLRQFRDLRSNRSLPADAQ